MFCVPSYFAVHFGFAADCTLPSLRSLFAEVPVAFDYSATQDCHRHLSQTSKIIPIQPISEQKTDTSYKMINFTFVPKLVQQCNTTADDHFHRFAERYFTLSSSSSDFNGERISHCRLTFSTTVTFACRDFSKHVELALKAASSRKMEIRAEIDHCDYLHIFLV